MKEASIIATETIQNRLSQAEEMSKIWDESTELVQMYLKGCMSTALALTGQANPPPKKTA